MDPSVMVMARAMVEEINESQSPKNVILSPLSLSALLSILAFGANGETLQQFLRFLGAQDTEELLDKSRAIFALLSSSGDGDAETSKSLKRPRGSQDSGVDPPDSPAMGSFNMRRVGREPEFFADRQSLEQPRNHWQGVNARREPDFCTANANWGSHRSLERPGGFQDNGGERLQVTPVIEPLNRQWPPQPVHTGREPEFSIPNLSGVDRELFNRQFQSEVARVGREPFNSRFQSEAVHVGREPDFSLANAIWVDHRCHLIPSFIEIAQSEFKASVKNVDLVNKSEQVRKDVNAWAEKETKGLIKDLLPKRKKLGPALCLANALYFKGAWKIPFRASNTRDEDFHLLNAETTKVPFMIMEDERLSYGSFPDFKLLKLPYQQGKATKKQFSMYIFLPHERDGLRCLLEKFSSGCRSLRLKNLHLQLKELSRVWIPKMKFSYTFEEVKDDIEAVGLTRPFLEYGADFSKMASSREQLYIKSILQKCLIEVNEEGTEAAAVTVCMMGFGCAMSYVRPPKPSFVADHPFMFMIVEDFTNNIAFTGAVLNPLLTE